MKIEFSAGRSDVVVDWRIREFLSFNSHDNSMIKEQLCEDLNWYYTSRSGLTGFANIVDRPYLEQLPTYRDVEGKRTVPQGDKPVIAVCREGMDSLPAIVSVHLNYPEYIINITCCDPYCYLDGGIKSPSDIKLGKINSIFGEYTIIIKSNRDKIPYRWKCVLFNYARDLIKRHFNNTFSDLISCDGAYGAIGIHKNPNNQFYLLDKFGIPLIQLEDLKSFSRAAIEQDQIREYFDREFTWITSRDFVNRSAQWWSFDDPDDYLVVDKLDWKYFDR